MTDTDVAAAEAFIARWQGVTASELSTSQSFLIDLCELLGVDRPHPTPEQDYMFERPLTFQHADGSTSPGRVDLYRRGAFVLESKKLRQGAHTKGFDEAMLRAHSQAQNYARALPAAEGRPPFLLVVDVGHRIELYSEFSRSGGSYVPFPDPRSHRIALQDLRDAGIRDRLRRIWLDPLALDPSRESARVTREIAARLAELAKSLERSGHAPEAVAQFLMRCLFTMFAEDVRLLPQDSFRNLLQTHADKPDVAMRMLAQLWQDMDGGGFSAVIAGDVLRFNGKLFKQPDTLPLDSAQIALLIDAARADWKHVEPAIFGTLLERALSTADRHKLGAHYTPRAYVERLVLPTVIEPLRAEWSDVRAAVLVQLAEAELARSEGMESTGRKSNAERLKQYNIELGKARELLLGFHKRLCDVRVLDPACGSGNFLYVTLEHLKRLEGEVLNAFEEFGLSRLGITEQTGIDVEGARAISTEAQTVDPHNLLGIELNPRAAAIAEVVLWIGYLQWHYRTRGDVNPPVPVIRDFRNIENRDAVLAHDGVEYVTDAAGVAVTRWDGETMKVSPVTGEKIPDEAARVPLERYRNPRKAAWPQADFVVGNPPFIGNKRMRSALGDGYVEALRSAWDDVPESADFVMYWWHHAAQLTRSGALQRFGLITTNSIRQAFNRRVLEPHLSDKKQPLSLVFAIPDHPWVDTADGAAVRIAMTVALSGSQDGRLLKSVSESENDNGEVAVALEQRSGRVYSGLQVGANVAGAIALRANAGLCGQGVKVVGEGFYCEESWTGRRSISRIINARDVLDGEYAGKPIIDFFELSEADAKEANPDAYQRVLTLVKPLRDQNKRKSIKELWWRFAWERPVIRKAVRELERYFVTLSTAKHGIFASVPANLVWDGALFAIATDRWEIAGCLSSGIHRTWALSAGGTLEDRPTWTNSTCFEPFPFPVFNDQQAARIRDLAEQLDAHRKRQQAAHPGLTLTGMYNVLDALRSGTALSTKERAIHEQGLVSVLRQLHDDLDAAVLDAYGWSDLLPLLRMAHGNDALLPSPSGRRAGDEGASGEEPPSPQPLSRGERGFDTGGIKRPLPEESLHFARELRKTMTDPERMLWSLLRDRGLQGHKFRRQHPWPPYTLDFYCHELRLAVELDGRQHLDSPRDARRDAVLRDAGIETVRYWNHDVLQRTEQVLEDLWQRMLARTPSPPAPLPLGEGSKALSRDDAKRAFDEAILERLVALNAERAAEEARGHVRWLRPEFQNPQAGDTAPQQVQLDAGSDTDGNDAPLTVAPAGKPVPWPKDTVDQVRAVADLLAASPAPLSLDEIGNRFSARGPWKKRLPQLLDMLVALGRAELRDDGSYGAGR